MVQSYGSGSTDEMIKIKERSFLDRVKEYNITDLKPLYQSELFLQSGFTYDSENREILHSR